MSVMALPSHDGRTSEHRWDWVLSRMVVADVGKAEARRARRLLAAAGMHGHKYANDAVLAVIANAQSAQVTVFTADADDVARLVDADVVVRPL